MAVQDEIFQAYVIKRLTEDHSFGVDDFPITQSSSLNYLSSVSGVKIKETEKTKWQVEDDGYEKQKYCVADITPEEFIQQREENINAMLQKFPQPLAGKIKIFEECTKCLYVRNVAPKEYVLISLDKARILFKTKGKQNAHIRKLIDKHKLRIAPELSKKVQTQIQLSENEAKKKAKFYDLIQEIHKPKSPKDLCDHYMLLDELAVFANPQDLNGFIYQTPFKTTKSLKRRFTTELRRDIAKKVLDLYSYFASPDELEAQKRKVDSYDKSCDRYSKIEETGLKSLLGPLGAFEQKGLYGPDSKFANNQQKTHQQPTPPKSQQNIQRPTQQNKPQKGQVVEFLLFSDKDFEY